MKWIQWVIIFAILAPVAGVIYIKDVIRRELEA